MLFCLDFFGDSTAFISLVDNTLFFEKFLSTNMNTSTDSDEETSNSDNDEDSNKSVSSYSSEDSNISQESHLIETTPPPNVENNTENLADEGEGDEIEELLSDDLLSKLNVLHEREELMEPSLTLKDIPKLYDEVTSKDPDPAVRRGIQDNQVLEQLDEGGDLVDDEEAEDEVQPDPAGINVENILPYRTRRRVRFALPQLN